MSTDPSEHDETSGRFGVAQDDQTARKALPLQLRQVRDLFRGHLPGQLVIQLTDRCNGSCPQCGMRAAQTFARSSLNVDEVKGIIEAARARGITVVSFTGGEPLLLLEDLCTLIRFAAAAGMKYIRTGTNGFLFARPDSPDFKSRVARLADALAELPLRNFWISIDSSNPSVHEEMRGFPGVIRGIRKALPLFHERGLYPTANLGINRNIGGPFDGKRILARRNGGGCSRESFYDHYRESFKRFFEFVIDLGFTLVSSCYPMSVAAGEDKTALGAVYAAESDDPLVSFTQEEKALIFEALLDAIPEFRSRVRIFSPRCTPYALAKDCRKVKTVSYPCRGGIDFFFVDARGADAYPCGYRGKENLGKFWKPGVHSSATAECTLCEWECFRDPSYLLGPFLSASTHPLRLLKSVLLDLPFYRLWLEDWRYDRACDFFDGRTAPDTSKLSRFM